MYLEMRIKNSELRIKPLLGIENLHAGIGGKEILKGVSLTINPGEVHALMGPNGSGKSTLSNVLAGHPNYKVISGKALLSGKDILKIGPEARAKLGLFLAFQYPIEITGVSLFNFLKTAYTSVHGSVDFREFSQLVRDCADKLNLDKSFLSRAINEGFSGGEKKKAEILQMTVLKPKVVILDETDSGLDIDALKIVAQGINRLRVSLTPSVGKLRESAAGATRLPELRKPTESPHPKPGILLITHYFRILRYVKPDFVHVLVNGKIVAEGGSQLATKLEEEGYGWVKRK